MSGFNQVIVLGRLVRSPEQLTAKSGKQFIKATIAVSIRRKNPEGSDEERTTLLPVTIFGKTAEIFLKYVKAGDLVHLIGRLDGNEWETEKGEKRLSLSFIVEQLNLLPNERAKPQTKPQPKAPAEKPPEDNPRRKPDLNEYGEPNEIPF